MWVPCARCLVPLFCSISLCPVRELLTFGADDAYAACCRCGLWGAGYSMLLCFLQCVFLLPAAGSPPPPRLLICRWPVRALRLTACSLISPLALLPLWVKKRASCLLLNCLCRFDDAGLRLPVPKKCHARSHACLNSSLETQTFLLPKCLGIEGRVPERHQVCRGLSLETLLAAGGAPGVGMARGVEREQACG